MSTNHTPGEWTCERDGRPLIGDRGDYLIWDEADRTVARVPVPIHGIPIPKDETKANARLIAAAPDLLAACEAFLAGKPQCECGDDSGCSLAAARKLARAAIAKATGGPQ